MIRQSFGHAAVLAAALAMFGSEAGAAIVNVTVNGVVDFNVIQGNQAGIPSGSPVQMSFNVDSNVYTNSGSFPTRGYNVILNSFSMTVGGAPINIVDPQPPVYFVLRDNDPAVDGFFLSSNSVDFPFPAQVTIPGLAPVHDLDFLATYGSNTVLSSLNILDAVGTYDLTGISSYGWTVGRFGNAGAEYAYQSMTISVVPAPGVLALGLLAGVISPARRRRRV